MTITTPNTIINGWSLTNGCIVIHTTGVVIENSKLSSACGYVVDVTGSAYSAMIEDSEIDCANTNGTAIGEINLVVMRVNVHGCENGFDVDQSTTIRDSYIHDLFVSGASHTDGIQTAVGVNLNVIHNTILAGVGATSSIITAKTATAPHDVLYQDNLFGGGAYSLYCDQNGAGVNFQVRDNHWSRQFYANGGQFGPMTDCADETLSGNVWDDTGLPVPIG